MNRRNTERRAARAAWMITGLLLWAGIATAQDSMLRVVTEEGEDLVVEVRTRIRHTTVVVLPAEETILDFVVGDSEYWHLTGAANIAYLKPVRAGGQTNVALISASGRIFSLLATEDSGRGPHLVVRIEDPRVEAGEGIVAAVPHAPAFVARAEVDAYRELAQNAREAASLARVDADQKAAAAADRAQAGVEAFRAEYPTRLQFQYELSDRAREAPFSVEGMWHDGQFTYLRSRAQESPALYEVQDGDPSLVAYDLTGDGLYIVRRVLGDGWLQIGERRAIWRRNSED